MSDTAESAVVELTFEVEDDACMFVAVSAATSCTIVGELAIQRTDETILEYFAVYADAMDRTLEEIRAYPTVETVRVVDRSDDGVVIEVVLREPCLAATLADVNAVIRSGSATGGVATVVADVPPGVRSRDVIEHVLDTHPPSRLASKRTVRGRIPGVPDAESAEILGSLTDKQRRALGTALASGYFDWPRKSSAEECAYALGISQPTFSQHLRRAQQQVFTSLFRSASVPPPR